MAARAKKTSKTICLLVLAQSRAVLVALALDCNTCVDGTRAAVCLLVLAQSRAVLLALALDRNTCVDGTRVVLDGYLLIANMRHPRHIARGS